MEYFNVYYDEAEDPLYLAKEGKEAEVVELSPGVNMELDDKGNLIGVELFKASLMFKNVLKPMEKKLQSCMTINNPYCQTNTTPFIPLW